MALVPANITVNFTAFYIGVHNICWRLSTNPPGTETCFTVSCLGGGNPCSGTFSVLVDNETCTPVTYVGWVQAGCEEGTDNQIPFSYTFTPTPSCVGYEITCDAVPLLGFSISNAGSGYDDMDPPSTANGGITISGGGGSGVVVVATTSGGVITGFTFSNYGSGYVVAPSVVIAPPVSGTQAVVTAILGYCSGFTAFDCQGSSEFTVPGDQFQPGDSFKMCKVGTAPGAMIPEEYTTVVDNNCLCDCTNVTLSVTSEAGSVDYGYTTCDGLTESNGVYVYGTLNAGDPAVTACIVDGSFFYNVDTDSTTVSVTFGPCIIT